MFFQANVFAQKNNTRQKNQSTSASNQANAQTERTVPLKLAGATWINAMSGRAVSAPVSTSYGTAVLLDARVIFGCDGKGATVVEHGGDRRNESMLTALENDFFATVSNGGVLNFINPSGVTLWKAALEFEPLQITQGKDLRIFIKGKSEVSCYSLSGMRKWHIATESISDLPLCNMNDGSIIIFLTRMENGKTVGLRVSPFGEMLEEVIFAGNVKAASSCKDGVLLAFGDNSIGLATVIKNSVQGAWGLSGASGANPFICNLTGMSKQNNGTAAFVSQSGNARAVIVDTANGEVISTLDFSGINLSTLLFYQVSTSIGRDVLVICDGRTAKSVASDGSVLWSATLPAKKSSDIPWEQVAYTKDNCLIFFTTTWAVVGFKLGQDVSKYTASAYRKTTDAFGGYSSFYEKERKFELYGIETKLDSSLTDGNIANILSAPDYAKAEKKYAALVSSAVLLYKDSLGVSTPPRAPSVFVRDIEGTDDMLGLLHLFGTANFSETTATILLIETNITHIRTLLKNIEAFGYDRDGNVMRALEFVARRVPAHDDFTQKLICGAVYSVCHYMGAKTFNAGGRTLLSSMLGPQYHSEVRDAAREVLATLAAEMR